MPSILPGAVDAVVDDAGAAVAASGLPRRRPRPSRWPGSPPARARVGRDTGPTTLVQEAALEDDAVSFEKGCYLGQETVARISYRGRVNRRLRGLRFAGGPPATGGRVLLDGREVGRMTSAAATPDLGPIGLAILRREAEDAATVAVEAATGGDPVPARVSSSPSGRRERRGGTDRAGRAAALDEGAARWRAPTTAPLGDPRGRGLDARRLVVPLPSSPARAPSGRPRAPRRQPGRRPRGRRGPRPAHARGRGTT